MKLVLVQMRGDGIKDYKRTAERIEEQIREAAKTGADFIVLPECAYPAYLIGSDETAMKEALKATDSVISRIQTLAEQNKVYIAVGIAKEIEGKLYNAAIVCDRNGEIINLSCKSNLWHFDEKWFTAGQVSSVFETEFGTMGVMICADGRIPEMAAMLRNKGAKLIIDPVNLSAAAAKPELLSNQQYEFILQARARENGVYIVACDKCGVEDHIATYLGRSFVADPEGNIVVECSPDKEEIAICEVDFSRCRPVAARRPELYQEMARPTEELQIGRDLTVPYTMDELGLFTMLVRFSFNSAEEYLQKAVQYVRSGAMIYAELIVLPELRKPLAINEDLVEAIRAAISGDQKVALAGLVFDEADQARRSVLFINKQGIMGQLSATHCVTSVEVNATAGAANTGSNADEIGIVALTPACKIAAIFDEETDIPEIARTAMLKGADILLCYDDGSDPWRIKMMKTRAAENKIFVIRSASSKDADCSTIYNPDGGQICTTLNETEHAAAGYINTALSKFKNIVPGTHIVKGRIPSFYKELME